MTDDEIVAATIKITGADKHPNVNVGNLEEVLHEWIAEWRMRELKNVLENILEGDRMVRQRGDLAEGVKP